MPEDWLFNLHESLGIVVLGLVVVRLAYRLTHKPLLSATSAYMILL